MKSKREVKEKVNEIEDYLKSGKPIDKRVYSLKETRAFLEGLRWVLDSEVKVWKER